MKHLIIAALLLTTPLAGCLVEEPAPGSDSANATEGQRADTHVVEHDGYELRITEQADGETLTIVVDGFRYEVSWDGTTLRCPCRSYRSSIFEVSIEKLGDGSVAIDIDKARLGLVASVGASSTQEGQLSTVVHEPGSSQPTKPTVQDWLDLIDVMADEELQLLNKVAETDLGAYLAGQKGTAKIDLFWHDEAELLQLTDMLNTRIYAPKR